MRIASFIDERRTYKNTSLNKGVSLATFSEAKVEGELEVKAAKVVYMHIYIYIYVCTSILQEDPLLFAG